MLNILSSSNDIQPSTELSNQSPSGGILRHKVSEKQCSSEGVKCFATCMTDTLLKLNRSVLLLMKGG